MNVTHLLRTTALKNIRREGLRRKRRSEAGKKNKFARVGTPDVGLSKIYGLLVRVCLGEARKVTMMCK